MVSSGHSPRPPNEAPLETSPENTNKSEVTTWTGQKKYTVLLYYSAVKKKVPSKKKHGRSSPVDSHPRPQAVADGTERRDCVHHVVEMDDEEFCVPDDVLEKASAAKYQMVPTKSKLRYQKELEIFTQWQTEIKGKDQSSISAVVIFNVEEYLHCLYFKTLISPGIHRDKRGCGGNSRGEQSTKKELAAVRKKKGEQEREDMPKSSEVRKKAAREKEKRRDKRGGQNTKKGIRGSERGESGAKERISDSERRDERKRRKRTGGEGGLDEKDENDREQREKKERKNNVIITGMGAISRNIERGWKNGLKGS
ncbi:hypothetical protein GEV33_011519 [Tenebrio molitor]|uniref:Uncharacterized protein n=1 Tax=Tenebrio molitor TaxID=7067 RepID=A0A8J6HB44_TENMO|nr:hypothetical protein GEV33_011519 [Tenebrio molitor]